VRSQGAGASWVILEDMMPSVGSERVWALASRAMERFEVVHFMNPEWIVIEMLRLLWHIIDISLRHHYGSTLSRCRRPCLPSVKADTWLPWMTDWQIGIVRTHVSILVCISPSRGGICDRRVSYFCFFSDNKVDYFTVDRLSSWMLLLLLLGPGG
jgi:hypothetical protein